MVFPANHLSFHPVVTLSEQEGVCGYLAFAGALGLTKVSSYSEVGRQPYYRPPAAWVAPTRTPRRDRNHFAFPIRPLRHVIPTHLSQSDLSDVESVVSYGLSEALKGRIDLDR